MIEVGTEFEFANESEFVRLICNPPVAPVGMVITTGDHPVPGFNGAQVAVELEITVGPAQV
jgi:hypothetical protein